MDAFARRLALNLPLTPLPDSWRPLATPPEGPVKVVCNGQTLDLGGGADPVEAIRTASRHLGMFEVHVGGERFYVHNDFRTIRPGWHLPDRLGPWRT